MTVNALARNILFLLLCLSMTLFGMSSSFAADKFINYEQGSDDNAGSKLSPWKHAPADANASGMSKNYQPKPGDRFIFKGNVKYRGSLTLLENGELGNPIEFRGDLWGKKNAIFDGAHRSLLEPKQCQSAEDCYNHPGWENLYFVEIDEIEDIFSPLHIDGQRYWVAQSPNMPDPFWFDNRWSYYPIKLQKPAALTQSSLKLTARYDDLIHEAWHSARLGLWVRPNKVKITKVSGFSSTNREYTFEPIKNKIYDNRDSYFSLFNTPTAIDRPGEYFYDEQKQVLLFYPYFVSPEASREFEVGALKHAFKVAGRRNIVVKGFTIQNYVGGDKEWRAGTAVISMKKGTGRIVVEDNLIQHMRSSAGVGVIQFRNADNIIIRNNRIQNNQKSSGIRVSRTKNALIEKNYISKIGRTGIRVLDNELVQITDNYLTDINGVHGNGMSDYLKNVDVLVANNLVKNAARSLTYHGTRVPGEGKRLWVLNNVFWGRVNSWGKDMSEVFLFHNLIFSPEEREKGLRIPESDRQTIMKNNVVDGFLVKRLPEDWEVSSNVFTSRNFIAKNRVFGGKMDLKYLDKLTAKEGNTDMGENIYRYLPKEQFPQFDFSQWEKAQPVGPSRPLN